MDTIPTIQPVDLRMSRAVFDRVARMPHPSPDGGIRSRFSVERSTRSARLTISGMTSGMPTAFRKASAAPRLMALIAALAGQSWRSTGESWSPGG